MIDLTSAEVRRNPFPFYAQFREKMPLLFEPQIGAWLIFDYDGVKSTLTDHEQFSSDLKYAARGNPEWIIFMDPPRHTRLRGLISRALSPGAVAMLEPRIREISRRLLRKVGKRGAMDLVEQYAAPLPMMVIAEMIGMPAGDWRRLRRWNDTILKLSYTVQAGAEADAAVTEYNALQGEMHPHLRAVIEERRAMPQDDWITGLVQAEVDGKRLTESEIIGFVELLIVAGQETTSSLIANAVICLCEHPEQRARLKAEPELLESAIEEVLRYRSPVQWLFRATRCDVDMHGQTIPRGAFVIPIVGSANRDPRQFADPDSFDLARNPNSHIAFGHGIHFCVGAALSRLEARVALPELLECLGEIEVDSSTEWEPRAALHVHGPARLPIRFRRQRDAAFA